MDIQKALCQEYGLKTFQVENTVKLIDEGNTIPFIARYRKELTGSLDDQVLRELSDRLAYLRGLDERRAQIRGSIAEQGKLTDEISRAIDAAQTLAALEDIYRPYKPKRRTRATIAKERGLEPLAVIILGQDLTGPLEEAALAFVDAGKEVPTAGDAIQGACDIIAEMISDDAGYRATVRQMSRDSGLISSSAADAGKESVYEMYYDYQEPVSKIAGHRVLAVNRGEAEGFLKVKLETPVDNILAALNAEIVRNNYYTRPAMERTVEDAYSRLIAPSIERELRNDLTEAAEESAVKVFAENLRQLLLQSPIKDKTVLALDPGYRTGCKIAVIDGTGKVLETGVVYAAIQKDTTESRKMLKTLIRRHDVALIAIGNGTASRETENVVAELIREMDKDLHYVMVNEAGASVYSASKLGAEEFPQFDVSLRSAVSIGRRLQDPLAELVKIDPKSIGVGQYQHDMNQKRLGEALGGVVESCVNNVGVDLNTASPSLLSYVAGISASVAKSILEYREEHGKFSDRKELLKVKKLGPKAFEQCAGFLRIPGGRNPLDGTGVHPESYEAAERLIVKLGFRMDDLRARKLKQLKQKIKNMDEMAGELGVGAPTLIDIIGELEKPGRDPREDMPPVVLRSDVLGMEDLTEGMVLKGTVRNVIDFGAFVDIGVHQDGLVHISQMSDKYIKHPLEAVSVGDIVDVRVISVDLAKKRIALTMKGMGRTVNS